MHPSSSLIVCGIVLVWSASLCESSKASHGPVASPYRYVHSSKHTPSPTGKANSTFNASSLTSANKDKNWLLTKAWLIDNINRLRHEIGELERDYSQHLQAEQQNSVHKEQQLLADISKLRADHTVLSQQQKQILYLIKKRTPYFKIKGNVPSRNDINYKTNGMDHGKASDPARQMIKRDLQSGREESFEAETKRNMKQVFAELSSLHDVTVSLLASVKRMRARV